MSTTPTVQTEIAERVHLLWEKCHHNTKDFNRFINKIIAGKPPVEGFSDEWGFSESLKSALKSVSQLIGPDYIASLVPDRTVNERHPAKLRLEVIDAIKAVAAAPLGTPTGYQPIDTAPHFLAANKAMGITTLNQDNPLFTAMRAFDGVMGLAQEQPVEASKVERYTLAINAILAGDKEADVVEPAAKEAYQTLFDAVNNPKIIAEAIGVSLFAESMHPSEEGAPSNRGKSNFTLGQVRDLRRDHVGMHAAMIRQKVQNFESLESLVLLTKATPDQGVWHHNVCEQISEGTNLVFRPMPVAIWNAKETSVEGESSAERVSAITIRAAMINGSFSLQVFNPRHQNWIPVATDQLSRFMVSNPYQTNADGSNRVEQWSWNETKQILKRRFFESDGKLKVESLQAAKQPLIWQSKGDNTGFPDEKPDSQITVNCDQNFNIGMRIIEGFLEPKAMQFPSISHLQFKPEGYPKTLQVTAKLLNSGVAEVYRKRLEDAMNNIYEHASDRKQALDIFREVAMQRRPNVKLIGATQTELAQAYDELCELLQPKAMEQQLAAHLVECTEDVVNNDLWDNQPFVPERPATGGQSGAPSIPAGPTIERLHYTYDKTPDEAAEVKQNLREALSAVTQEVHQMVSQQVTQSADEEQAVFDQRYQETFKAQFQQRFMNQTDSTKTLRANIIQPLVVAMIIAGHHSQDRSRHEGFGLLPEAIPEINQIEFQQAYVNNLAKRLAHLKKPEGLEDAWYKEENQVNQFETAARYAALTAFKDQVQENLTTNEQVTYAEVSDVVRLRLAHEVHEKTPESRFTVAYDHVKAKLSKPEGTFRSIQNIKFLVGFDRSRVRPEGRMQRMAQPITAHVRALQAAGDHKTAVYETNKTMVIKAFINPDLITHCDNAAYLERLHAALHAVYEMEDLNDYFEKLAAAKKTGTVAADEEREQALETQEQVSPHGEQHQQAGGAGVGSLPSHEEAKKFSSIEVDVPKHPDDYTNDDKTKIKEIQQQLAREAQEVNVSITQRDLELAAQREITEKHHLTKEDLADLCEHTRALIVSSSVAMQANTTFIGPNPTNQPRGWTASLNFHNILGRKCVSEHYAGCFDFHAKTKHPSEMQPTGRWRFVPNESKGSKGLFKDDQGEYWRIVYHNPQGVTEYKQLLGINIPFTGKTHRYLQETRVRKNGFNTTVTHLYGAEDNMRLIRGKISNVTINAGKDDLQVILAHVRAAWNIGGFNSVDVVYNTAVPESLESYFQKNMDQQRYQNAMQKEQEYREGQAGKLQAALTKLAESMAKDCDRLTTDASEARSPVFKLTFNGQTISIPNPANKAGDEETVEGKESPPFPRVGE